MAKINLWAKFFSEALEFKATPTGKNARYYGGLRYEDFIYPRARKMFPDYSRLYPDNQEFTQKLVRAVKNNDPQLLKIINPEIITQELVAFTQNLDSEAALEQAHMAATAAPNEATSSHQVATGGLRPPFLHALNAQISTPISTPPSLEEEATTMASTTEEKPASSPAPSETKQTESKRGFNPPKIPQAVTQTMTQTRKNFANQLGTFIKKNQFKLVSGIFAGAGGWLGGNLAGTPGALFGAIGGGSLPFAIKNGAGGFFGRIGNGAINMGADFSNRVSRMSVKGPPKKVWVALLGAFSLLILTGVISPGISPSQQPTVGAAPVISPGPTYTGGGGAGIISCPLNGTVTISNGSKDTGGHCSPSYEAAYGVCVKPGSPGYTGRDTAIDVTSSDRYVYLPPVKDADQVKWTVDEAGNITITDTEGGGISVAAHITDSNNKTYRIRFVHIDSTNLKIGDEVNAGTAVGQYAQYALNNPYGAHVHITLQENGIFKPADLYFKLCQ